MDRKRYMALGLSVVLGMSMTACQKEEEPEEEVAVAVEVENPRTGELTVDTAYIGTVAPQEQVYVIPKASGTVTETFFEVGDQVQEGDVLFKIDDEAAQLQMANARAAYDSAQAGITAQSSGARDLQNYQTEEQIRQLRESLDDTDVKINELEDDLGDLRDAGSKLSNAKKQAQEGANMAGTAYYAAQLELTPQIEAKKAELAETQKQLAAVWAQIDAAKENAAGSSTEIPPSDGSGSTETDGAAGGASVDTSALEAQAKELQTKADGLGTEVQALTNQLDGVKAKFDQAQTGVNQLQTQIDSINAAKTQIKTGIDSAEDGRDTINDNLAMAEQAYAITQNEIYPETDAVSAAQLQQASIGIDSAKMQLDFCTVTSPISGIVESVSVEKNGMAAAGNPAYIISNKESMTVTFHVAEKAKNALTVGEHVRVERDGTDYDGIITEIGTMTNPQTKLFQVKATVAGAGASLPNGVSVKVYATTEKDSGKLILPYDSIYFSAGDAYVYCVEDGKIVKTDVTVGLMSDTEAVIEEGVTADSQVISNWSSKLRNGVEADVVSVNGEPAADAASPEEEAEEPTDGPEETGSDAEEPLEAPDDDTETTGEAE